MSDYQLHNVDCLEFMRTLPDNSIDTVITSPPYDNLREYGKHKWEFEPIVEQLFRVTKDGGVIVWVVGDAVVDGSESCTSFRQALFFRDTGFRLHDTMIYWKNAFPFPDQTRYAQVFEYMFIFSKGAPKTTNIIRVPTNKENRIKSKNSNFRKADGTTVPMEYETGKADRNSENIWIYEVGFSKTTTNKDAFAHPAMFPEKLAKDHVYSWSNPGDTIFDPFMGSGTTGFAALQLGRKFIGCEIEPKYFAIAEKRIRQTAQQAILDF